MSLTVPGFEMFVYGSSCNSLIFGHIVSSFLSTVCIFLGLPFHLWEANKLAINRKKKRRSENKAEKDIHELPYTETINLGLLDWPHWDHSYVL